MSCYFCTECQRMRDGDYIVGNEHPVHCLLFEKVCEDCYNDLEVRCIQCGDDLGDECGGDWEQCRVDGKLLCRVCSPYAGYAEPTPSATDILGEIGRITEEYFKKLDKVVEKGND